MERVQCCKRTFCMCGTVPGEEVTLLAVHSYWIKDRQMLQSG